MNPQESTSLGNIEHETRVNRSFWLARVAPSLASCEGAIFSVILGPEVIGQKMHVPLLMDRICLPLLHAAMMQGAPGERNPFQSSYFYIAFMFKGEFI